MTHAPAKHWGFLLPLIAGLILATLACSLLSRVPPPATPTQNPAISAGMTPTGSSPGKTPAASGPTPAGVTPTGPHPGHTPSASGPTPAGATPTVSQSDVVTVTQAVTFGPGLFILSDTQMGLADLSSYTATLTVAFDGMVNGQPAKWSRTYVMLASKDPAARQLTIQTSGDVSNTESVFMAEIDGADYVRRGQNDCTANPIETGNSLSHRLEPARFLKFVIGAEEAGGDTVNSVAAKHYTFDERALGQQGLTQSSGELWVASSGSYLVKYLLTTKAAADYFGDGIAGTLTQEYELTGVGQPVSIQLPGGCPEGMVNAPQLPDASNVVNSPGVLTYDTATSLADAAAFYQKQMPDLGWKLQDPADITDTAAYIDFQRGDQNMTVSVTTNAGVITVTILLSRAQQ